jgi:hypothetical protein
MLTKLKLEPLTIDQEYRKKWNIGSERDYVCLQRNGELVNDSVYRVGGMGGDITKDYFLLLKHTEAFYEDNITNDKSRKPHLRSTWCIVDKNGVEKVVFDQFRSPYLVKDSCIYFLESNYYNIETGEHYGTSYTSMESDDFLFIDNRYGKDETKKGVLKINKKDGTWELFK